MRGFDCEKEMLIADMVLKLVWMLGRIARQVRIRPRRKVRDARGPLSELRRGTRSSENLNVLMPRRGAIDGIDWLGGCRQ